MDHVLLEVLQNPTNEVDFASYELSIVTKLNDFERRIWGELDSRQLKIYN